jgi:preprotein translocase subunit SecA
MDNVNEEAVTLITKEEVLIEERQKYSDFTDLFDQMVYDIEEDTVRHILSVLPRKQSTERVQIAKPTSVSHSDSSVQRKPAVSKKVGRNDPCPCGSGKKYKKCCGQNESET